MSINVRTLKNGKKVYTAQVRIMRQGTTYSDSSTFASKDKAQVWLKRRKSELKGTDAQFLVKLKHVPRETLTGIVVIERYIAGQEKIGDLTLSPWMRLSRQSATVEDRDARRATRRPSSSRTANSACGTTFMIFRNGSQRRFVRMLNFRENYRERFRNFYGYLA